MWYYGWILFSLAFAAICAAISIRFVMKRQDNFAGTLDMFKRRSKMEMSQINTLKIYANNNTDIFTKIARRCICYPLGNFFLLKKFRVSFFFNFFLFFPSTFIFEKLGCGNRNSSYTRRRYSIRDIYTRPYILLSTW